MQALHASNQTMWKQVYQDALFELDPRRLQPKLEAAHRAVEDRLFEIRSGGDSGRREVMELTNAQHILQYLQEHEQQI